MSTGLCGAVRGAYRAKQATSNGGESIGVCNASALSVWFADLTTADVS